MLDDISAEEITPSLRDEVLGPLLHYRMVHKLPTFFSSNFNFEELEFHLSKTRQGAEITKASRIMERIKTITDRKSTRLNSSHVSISYAVFCLKKKTSIDTNSVMTDETITDTRTN